MLFGEIFNPPYYNEVMMINIMMIHSKSSCSRGATHALPGAGVGQTLPRWPMLFLKKYQSIDDDDDCDHGDND